MPGLEALRSKMFIDVEGHAVAKLRHTVRGVFMVACLLSSGLSAAPAKFGDSLNETFHHPRCLNCHQFNSSAHAGRSFNSHRARFLCDRCHSAVVTGLARNEWIAPQEKLDWTDHDARATCELIKKNMGAGDLQTHMLRHLLTDSRVLWALDNGNTPQGLRATVPGGYLEFSQQVQRWVGDGMLCD